VGSNCSNGFCFEREELLYRLLRSSCNTPDVANCRARLRRTDGFCNSFGSQRVTYYAHSSATRRTRTLVVDSENWSDCREEFCASPHYSPGAAGRARWVHHDRLCHTLHDCRLLQRRAHPAGARSIAAASTSQTLRLQHP